MNAWHISSKSKFYASKQQNGCWNFIKIIFLVIYSKQNKTWYPGIKNVYMSICYYKIKNLPLPLFEYIEYIGKH